MQVELPPKLFITGTDTGVGKSLVSAILVVGLQAEYWKPVQSGLDEITDTDWIRIKTALPEEYFHTETYRLIQPLSPHASAQAQGVRIDLGAFQLPKVTSRHLVVEGAGGIMVPLNEQDLMIDLMKKLSLPVVLVARSTLGTINHTLLSLEQLRRYELNVIGVVMNGPRNSTNREAIEHYGKVPVLAEIELLDNIDPNSLKKQFDLLFLNRSSDI
jgi:dethiobiotin synthetase